MKGNIILDRSERIAAVLGGTSGGRNIPDTRRVGAQQFGLGAQEAVWCRQIKEVFLDGLVWS